MATKAKAPAKGKAKPKAPAKKKKQFELNHYSLTQTQWTTNVLVEMIARNAKNADSLTVNANAKQIRMKKMTDQIGKTKKSHYKKQRLFLCTIVFPTQTIMFD